MMNSELKKEFLQKYKLDNFSKAIPSRSHPGKVASLAEYCEPVDTRVHQGSSEEDLDYTSDPDKRYAEPQDAIDIKRLNQPKTKSDSIDNDVYELAQTPPEECNVSLQKKPSPKPRHPKHKKTEKEASNDCAEEILKNSSTMSPDSGAETQIQKKRPGKKVVEIEYEVASEIRLSQRKESSPGKVSIIQDQNGSKISVNSNKYTQSAIHRSQCSSADKPQDSKFVTPAVSQQPPSDFVYSMSQPIGQPENFEGAYEEPWDLKMKRLKQEQENKVKKQSKKSDKPMSVQKSAVTYQKSWGSPGSQHKSEERLSFGRSVSQTSETEIFHDALDNFTEKIVKNEIKPAEKDQQSTVTLNSLPQNTYEDAWDLKNSLLEMKIREMQLQASAIYEEPWDSSKSQKQLQTKLLPTSPVSGANNSQEKPSKHRSSCSEAPNIPQEGESNAALSRGKHHSFVESPAKVRSHGCNIGQKINPLIPLASQNWYHGNISREDSEKMLCVCKEGSYIVRISSDRRSYSLSIKSSRQYIHVQIDQKTSEDGSICYILGKNSKEFCTIPEMIDYYTHHRVPLKGAEHITLLHPVECKWS